MLLRKKLRRKLNLKGGNKMARPRKFPTKVVRIRKKDLERLRRLAKLKGLSVPDYLNWKLRRYDK